jgi:hypothetical protein
MSDDDCCQCETTMLMVLDRQVLYIFIQEYVERVGYWLLQATKCVRRQKMRRVAHHEYWPIDCLAP